MVGTIWGGGEVGLTLAALQQQQRAMKRLELDMISMDQPGFTQTTQETSINYSNGKAIGIDAGTVREVTDTGAENQLRCLSAQLKQNEELAGYIGNYERAFGQMGGSNAFLNSGNKIVTTLSAVCSKGGDTPQNKKAVLDAIADHTRQINILANKLQDLRNSASQGLSTEIPTINNLLKDIAAINGSIQSSADASGDANVSYSRQRRVLLNQLAEHIQIVVEEGGDSEFLVYTPKGRVLVQGSLAAEFIYNQPAAIDASQTFSAGTITLQSLKIDKTAMESPSTGTNATSGHPSDPNYYDRKSEAFIFDVTTDFTDAQGGSLSGIMSFLQNDSVAFGQSLDAYAAGLRDSFNALHNLSSAIQPRATLGGSNSGYIGGSTLVTETPAIGAGTLRIAVVNTSTNSATISADIDLSSVTTVDNTNDNTSLCYLINNSSLSGHVTASIVNGALQIATTDTNCGISLGSVEGSPAPTISDGISSTAYGFSEFFHLNDILTTPSTFWRGGSITGLSSSLTVSSAMLSNPSLFSINELRDSALGTEAQAVSGDPSIGRSMIDLFTRTKTSFQTSGSGTISQTLEDFSKGLVQQVANAKSELDQEIEGQEEAYSQQELLFQQNYGMDEQEIAIRSMQISKSQDLYFSFLNNYWRMMSNVANMGRT